DVDKIRQKAKLPLKVTIENEEPLAGAAGPPSWFYDARLEVDRKGYQVTVPISQTLAPKESDRFIITLWAKQSSVHRFKLSVRYNRDQHIDLGVFHLSYYLPRSRATMRVESSRR